MTAHGRVDLATPAAPPLQCAWFLDTAGLSAWTATAQAALLAITDPGDPLPTAAEEPGAWGLFEHIAFLDGDYDDDVIRMMGAEEFERCFQDYFDAQRARSIRGFVARAAADPGIEDLIIYCPEGAARSSAVALWAARAYSTAMRPELADVPNELMLVLLEDPERFEERLRIAKRRARAHFVSTRARPDELGLSDWVQRRAEQWLV